MRLTTDGRDDDVAGIESGRRTTGGDETACQEARADEQRRRQRNLRRHEPRPEPGGRPAEAYCRQSVVDAQIYEHGSALRGADLNPRSRRLRKSAKGSGHYRRRFRILAVVDDCRLHEGMPGATGRYVVVRHAGCPRVGQARRRTRGPIAVRANSSASRANATR